ncbi:hypothetical protein R1flu_022583 [Riccia fluitans]|uniref:Uncharacterized protein n=1 Tax=Riccia fluitans TaxID=41844 RepID=A0ABD1XSH9_9MARC
MAAIPWGAPLRNREVNRLLPAGCGDISPLYIPTAAEIAQEADRMETVECITKMLGVKAVADFEYRNVVSDSGHWSGKREALNSWLDVHVNGRDKHQGYGILIIDSADSTLSESSVFNYLGAEELGLSRTLGSISRVFGGNIPGKLRSVGTSLDNFDVTFRHLCGNEAM